MNFIALAGNGDLVIGPGTCFTGGGESPLIRKHVAVLPEAVGTIGGNLCRCMGYDTIIKAVEKRMDEDS